MSRIPLVALLAGAALACSRPGRELPEVRVFAAEGLPADVLADAARRLGVARVTVVRDLAAAELAWAADPAEALLLGDRVAPGSAPPAPGVPERWLDRRGRFAPVAARARVLLVARDAELPADPSNVRDLADPRLRGRVALAPFGHGAGPVTVAALVLAYGDASATRFLRLVAGNAPRLADTDGAARALVSRGEAWVALAASTDGAAAAASAAPLDVVYPDQAGAGAIVLPTAIAVLRGAGEGARRLAAWLAGADAERVLVARAPGLLPLRTEIPVPVGVEPAGNLAALPLDWDALAAETARQRARLARWPEGFSAGGSPDIPAAAPDRHP